MCHLFPNNLKVGILSSVRMVPLKMAGEWLVVPLLVGGRTQLQPAWEEQREPSEHDSGADNGGLQGWAQTRGRRGAANRQRSDSRSRPALALPWLGDSPLLPVWGHALSNTGEVL